MLKLGDLVEVGGVVFIALEDHEHALADAKALAEVEDTAHEEGRVELCEVEQMSDHRGGRGFAVGAGEDHGMLILKEEGTERVESSCGQSLDRERLVPPGCRRITLPTMTRSG